jgi:mitochondrial division protein 1
MFFLTCLLLVAPVIMTPRMANATASLSSRPRAVAGSNSSRSHMDFATLGRAPMRLTIGSRRITSGDLQIVEATDELLAADVPESAPGSNVSLMRGFNATIPSAEKSRTRRRQMRNVDAPRIGLKKLGMNARGMLMDDEGDGLGDADHDHEGQSVASEDDVVMVASMDDRGRKGKKRGRESLSTAKVLGKEELKRQTKEILRDKENIHVRRVRLTHCRKQI